MTTNENKESVTLNGMSFPNLYNVILATIILAISIYKTALFFTWFLPSEQTLNELPSNIEFILNPISNIFGIPLSLLGIVFASFMLIGVIFPSGKIEKTNSFFSYINAFVACFIFILSIIFSSFSFYSLIYFVASILLALLFYKKSKLDEKISFPFLLSEIALMLILITWALFSLAETKSTIDRFAKQNYEQFLGLPFLDDPVLESEFKLFSATDKFKDAPIRITIFSDFECPYCKNLADRMEIIGHYFPKKINMQYIAYPLDSRCNPDVKSKFHEFACRAAQLAICGGKDFKKIHDILYSRTQNLTEAYILEHAKKFNIEKCINDGYPNQVLAEHLNVASKYNIKGTPMVLLNGKLILNNLTIRQWYILLSGILAFDKK